MNRNAAAGLTGMSNKLFLWIMLNDDIYGFVKEFIKLVEQVMHSEYPAIVRRLIVYARGIPLAKDKKIGPGNDIRPVIITNALVRLLDKVIVACHQNERRDLVGPYH